MWDHSQKIRRANLNAGLVAAAWETQLQILIYELSECRQNYLFAFEEMFDLELDLIILSAKLEGVDISNSLAPTEMDMVYCWALPFRPN